MHDLTLLIILPLSIVGAAVVCGGITTLTDWLSGIEDRITRRANNDNTEEEE